MPYDGGEGQLGMFSPSDSVEYPVRLPVDGKVVRILGPLRPHGWDADPEVRRRREKEGYLPYWTTPSPAAVMLVAAAREAFAADTQRGAILEIGSGLGTAAIALAVEGHPVIATDYDEAALAFIRASAALNGATLAGLHRLDWRDPPPKRYDRVMGADVVYEAGSIRPVIAFMRAALAPGGTALLSGLDRSAFAALPEALREAGLTCNAAEAAADAIPPAGAIDKRRFLGRVLHIRTAAHA